MAETYKKIKEAEEEFREFISSTFPQSLTFKKYKKITDKIESQDNLEKLLKGVFELEYSNAEKAFFPTEKMKKIYAFISAYRQSLISSGKKTDLSRAFFDLYRLYGRGKSLPETVWMHPSFTFAYQMAILMYDVLMEQK